MTKALEATSVLNAFWAIATALMIWFIVRAKARPLHQWGNPRKMQYYHRNKERGKHAASLAQSLCGKPTDHGFGLAVNGSPHDVMQVSIKAPHKACYSILAISARSVFSSAQPRITCRMTPCLSMTKYVGNPLTPKLRATFPSWSM